MSNTLLETTDRQELTYAESWEVLQKAKIAGAAHITVELDEGEFTVTLDEAIEYFEEYLAPGQGFTIIKIIFPNIKAQLRALVQG